MSAVARLGTPEPGGMRRSIDLVRAFKVEQTDPEAFYGLLARDTIGLIEQHHSVRGATLLDVGAGRPQFAREFGTAGADYFAVDPDDSMLRGLGEAARTVVGDGLALPFRSESIDVVLASNVFEHVPDPVAFGSELLRVTRPGGVCIVSYTNWLSPWGGHETSPFHYLGAERAARRYQRKYGHKPKNRINENMYRVSVSEGLRWARSARNAELVEARPRYYPPWASWITAVPGFREVVTWNLWMVLRRK